MTHHKKYHPKRAKNKIVTPKTKLTQLMYKKRKSRKNNDKISNFTTDFHKKEQTNTILVKSKIKLLQTAQEKVHTPLVKSFNLA